MGKLDKKTLKILKTRQYTDLDAGDIAIALKCDDENAQESLNSLKDQGLIESFSKDGKMFWRLMSDEPLKETKVAEIPIVRENKSSTGETEEFTIELLPKEPIQPADRAMSAEPATNPQKVITSETQEFLIDMVGPDEPTRPFQIVTNTEPEKKHQDKSNSETEEFFINLLSEKPVATQKKQADFMPEPVPPEKSSMITEEFYSNLLSKKTAEESVKAATTPLQAKPEEKKHSGTEAIDIELLLKDSKARTDLVVDDETRGWNLPPELIYKAKVAHDGKFIKKTIDKTEEDNPLKRVRSPIAGIIFSIFISVLFSAGFTVLAATYVARTTNDNLQALKTTVMEASAQRDQRIEMLAKKINLLDEKTDRLQKYSKVRGKKRPIRR